MREQTPSGAGGESVLTGCEHDIGAKPCMRSHPHFSQTQRHAHPYVRADVAEILHFRGWAVQTAGSCRRHALGPGVCFAFVWRVRGCTFRGAALALAWRLGDAVLNDPPNCGSK